ASPADPAPATRPADAAVAAAPEGAVPAAGGSEVPGFPGRPRDLPRVPTGRLRPAVAEEAVARLADSPAGPRRRRDVVRLALFGLPAVRLRRELHVRGRHASRRAAGAGAVPRPRAAAGAARSGGTARA